MEFPSSQPTEFFDAPEQPDGNRILGSPEPNSPAQSEGLNRHESRSPTPPNELPFMRLLPPPTEQSYPTIIAPFADVNKTASRQGYNVVRRAPGRQKRQRWKSP